MDDDGLNIATLNPEAEAAGLHKGDRLVDFDGQPYQGTNHWVQRLGASRNALRPGDLLTVTVEHAGSRQTAQIHLTAGHRLPTRVLTAALLLDLVPPLICLLIGYWVASARPHDKNAWLLLALLTFLEVLSGVPNWWPGAWLAFLGTWYMTFQTLGSLTLLLFGIYFPERWRLDAKLPFLNG